MRRETAKERTYRHAIHAVETHRRLDGSSSTSLAFRLDRCRGLPSRCALLPDFAGAITGLLSLMAVASDPMISIECVSEHRLVD